MINTDTGLKMKAIGPTLRHEQLMSSRCGIGFVRNEQEDLVVWFYTLPHRLAYAWRRGANDAFRGLQKREVFNLTDTDKWYNKGYDLMKEHL